MIMSAIFIDTFFSACGACAEADAVNASESRPVATIPLTNAMCFSRNERSGGDVRHERRRRIWLAEALSEAAAYSDRAALVQANSGRPAGSRMEGRLGQRGGERL